MKKLILLSSIALISTGAWAKERIPYTGLTKWERVVQQEEIQARNPYKGKIETLLREERNSWKRYKYLEDSVNYGVEEYWATRKELEQRMAGDCEDFAIKGYFDLLELGIADSRMDLVLGRVRNKGIVHVVLRVDDVFLDIRSDKILPMSVINNYMEVYAYINREGLHQ